MSDGLIALLDDIATLAKATASSLDDIVAGATKASSKAVSVIIDDTAVTPQYVAGLDPSRELPIIQKIARASLINRLVIILLLALLLTWLAPWMLPVLLLLGGSFLSFEDAEKLLVKFHLLPKRGHENAPAATGAEELEKGIVSSANRIDLILSAEIILISLANVNAGPNTVRIGIMIAVAFFVAFFVYGLAAFLVKMDDLGLHLSKRQGPPAALGRGIVTIMPKVFSIIGIVGTVTMLRVDGHIVITSVSDLGLSLLHEFVEHVMTAVESLGGAATWTMEIALSGVFGLVWGVLVTYTWLGISLLIPRRHAPINEDGGADANR